MTLNVIISKRDPQNSVVAVPTNTLRLGQAEDDLLKALLVVIFTADGGEILHLTDYSDVIYDTKYLRDVLNSASCDRIMRQFSMPLVLGMMELLLFEMVRTLKRTACLVTDIPKEITCTKSQAVQPLFALSFQNPWRPFLHLLLSTTFRKTENFS